MQRIIAGETDYPLPFTCAIARDNIFATQFHPEKSHRRGPEASRQFRRLERTLSHRPPAPASRQQLRIMQIIPAIDLKDGHCVRLQAGRHAFRHRVLRGPGGDGAALARAGRRAPAPRRPERRGGGQAARTRCAIREIVAVDRRGDPGAAGRRHPRPRHDRALPRRRHHLRDHRHGGGEESRVPARRVRRRSPGTSWSGSTRATARSPPTAGRR